MAIKNVPILDTTKSGTGYDAVFDVPQTGDSYGLPKDVSITGNLAITGTVDGVNIGDNYANWNTAFGWGDHSAAGYLTAQGNLTGHITSTGLATVLGSFTIAQLSAALSDANISGNNTGDQTNITGNAATVTTNANLTGHVTSTGNAAVLGSFTLAQLNTALSDASLAEEPTGYVGQNLQTGTTYTLALSDAGKIIEMNNASANTLTIPANSSVAFPVDTRIDVIQYGAGLTTVAITTDTLRGDAVSVGQYKALSLWKRTSTEWVVFGGTTA